MLQILFPALLVALANSCEGYYWREWNGSVPSDAVVGGADSRGPFYIAKAWVPSQGIYAAQAFYGNASVDVAYSISNSLVASTNNVEVLCSDKQEGRHPFWLASTSTITSIYIEYGIVHPVIAGKTSLYNNNVVYFGKVSSLDYTYLGSVHTDFKLYIVHENGAVYNSGSYELLVLDVNHPELDRLSLNITENFSVKPDLTRL